MQRLKFHRLGHRVIMALIGISVLILVWLIAPAFSMREPQSKIFGEVWETVNSQFYDSNFNGVDWQAMRKKYEPQVAQAGSGEQVGTLINQMLAELKTSHTYFYTSAQPAYYQVLGIFAPRIPDLQNQLKKFFPNGKIEYSGIGIFTQIRNGKTFVSAILDGSPAAQTELQVGDQLLSVEGRPFQPIQSFVGKAGKPVRLSIQRSPDPSSPREIMVMPQQLDATTMFLDAQRASTQVIEREGKKIGYVHIWSYAGDQYQQQLEEDLLYGDLRTADSLILDLREGWGGAPLTALNIYTARGLSVTSVLRDGRRYTSNSRWQKPVVMLVNEGSRSAKEILALGFQKYRIGPVVGAKTPGAVVAGRPFLMEDGSLLYVAVADVFIDGNQRLEGKGVTPDILVSQPLEYVQGADPQKDRAIEIASAAIQRS